MQILIDFFTILSQWISCLEPRFSIVIVFIAILIGLFGCLDWLSKWNTPQVIMNILLLSSMTYLILGTIFMVTIADPITKGTLVPSYMQEHITNVKLSKEKRQIYTNDENIDVTFLYKDSKYHHLFDDDLLSDNENEHFYVGNMVKQTFDVIPHTIDKPKDTILYHALSARHTFNEKPVDFLDGTVYGYLVGTKNNASQATYAMLEKKNNKVIQTEDAKKNPGATSFEIIKIETTDGTATLTKGGKSKQIKIKNLYITWREFISDETKAQLNKNTQQNKDQDAVNKLIN